LEKDFMSFYNTVLKHLILPIGDAFFGGTYLQHLKTWEQFDSKSEIELQSISANKLKETLQYATTHVPYYKDLKFNTLSDFPILTKSILRAHKTELISSEFNIETLDKHHSSGSSGVQSFTYMTKDHTFYLRAMQTHWWHWSGYKVGDNLLQFGISQKRSFLKTIKDLFYRCTYVKAFGLSDTDLQAVLKKVASKKRLFIAGYPSVINQLAKASIHSGIRPDVAGIICFGDKLFDAYKSNMHAAFGNHITIVDTYGCAEGLLMACKRDLNMYYIMSPHIHLEIVDDEGAPVDDGKIGHVLVTCFTNRAMPLIRYKLGDLAIKLPKSAYPDQRLLQYPLLQKVIGRETDVIKTTKGVTLNIHSFTGVLEYYQDIKQYKIIQNTLEEITIEYILDDTHAFSTSKLTEIHTKLSTLTQQCLEIHFKEVTQIKAIKSGKPQIIESNLK